MTGTEPAPFYQLKLFVAGNSALSRRAIANLRTLCDQYLAGRVDLEVIDIYQQRELASLHQVVAAPTLVRVTPLPERRVVGDLSQAGRVLRGLDLNQDGRFPGTA